MMTHNSSNDDADNKHKNDMSQETFTRTSTQDTPPNAPPHIEEKNALGDDFFIDNNQQQHATSVPPRQSRSVLIIILTLGFSCALGLLIFGYIYDLAGMRSFATDYQVPPPQVKNKSVKATTPTLKGQGDTSAHGKIDTDDSLNASKKVQENIEMPQVDKTETSPDNVDNNSDDTGTSEVQNIVEPIQTTLLDNVYTKDDYTKKITDLHKNFKDISNQFLLLNQKLMQSEPYLDILIYIRSQLQSQKVSVPTLTEYATSGFPTDMIIANDGMKLLKKLSIIEARKDNSDDFVSFIKNFAIITPQSNTQGLTGIYRTIGKALDDGDFSHVEVLIGKSSAPTQQDLRDLYILVADKKAIYAEIKLLNDIIIDNMFQQTENNIKN